MTYLKWVSLLVFLVGVILFQWIYSTQDGGFWSGAAYLLPGEPESLALQEAGKERVPPLGLRVRESISLSEIPFADIQAVSPHLSNDLRYDVVSMPFELVWTGQEVLEPAEVVHILQREADGEPVVETLRDGMTLQLAGQTYRVADFRPWKGLYAHPEGRPMASVALKAADEPWTEGVVLADRQWVRLEPDIGLYFVWTDSEEAARQAAQRDLPGVESAQWGIVDGGQTHVSNSFAEGSSLEFRDGRRVLLTGYDWQHAFGDGVEPAIRIRIEPADEDGNGGQAQEFWIRANERRENPAVFFDFPAASHSVHIVYAWRPDTAFVVAYRDGEPAEPALVERGELWRPAQDSYVFRLDRAVQHAVPIGQGESTLDEVVLDNDERVLRLREGETMRIGRAGIQYGKRLRPPHMKYVMRLDAPSGAPMHIEASPTGEYSRAKQVYTHWSPRGLERWYLAYAPPYMSGGDPDADPAFGMVQAHVHVVPITLFGAIFLAVVGIAGWWTASRHTG